MKKKRESKAKKALREKVTEQVISMRQEKPKPYPQCKDGYWASENAFTAKTGAFGMDKLDQKFVDIADRYSSEGEIVVLERFYLSALRRIAVLEDELKKHRT